MLTRKQVENARPGKHADGQGLTLCVTNEGSRGWRFRYRFGGRENMLSFGNWPEVSIMEARRRRDEARAKLRDGVDPSAERRAVKVARRVAKT
ncbi:MAG: Arm DNA-binding domain-containing protein, partial [Rhodanobacteraceae bacterium]